MYIEDILELFRTLSICSSGVKNTSRENTSLMFSSILGGGSGGGRGKGRRGEEGRKGEERLVKKSW